MNRAVTFAEVRRLLERLGFVPVAGRSPFPAFEHPATGSLLVFPRHRGRDAVRPPTLVAVRKTLAENGLMEAAAFDRFLKKKPA